MRVAWLPAVVTPRRTPSAHAAERRDASPRLASPLAAGRDLLDRTRATIKGRNCRFPRTLSILFSALPEHFDVSLSCSLSLAWFAFHHVDKISGMKWKKRKLDGTKYRGILAACEGIGCNDITIDLILILIKGFMQYME